MLSPRQKSIETISRRPPISSHTMPSLPTKSNRRKGITPIKKVNQEHVWKTTLEYLGVEPIDTNSPSSRAVGEAPKVKMAPVVEGKTLGELPAEILKAIFKHSPDPDLIALSLVNKQFRSIAAEHLYRTFHIVFPDEDDPSDDGSVDALAGGLETFATSQYDHAAHLRDVILETSSGDGLRERSYRHYSLDVSCGKFMSSLLLLTLRKAKALETFKWDVRVELSRPVFKTLHGIRALQKLHLRMHSGSSLYVAPPDLQSSNPSNPTSQPYIHNNTTHLPVTNTISKSFKNGTKQSSEAQSATLKNLLPPTTAIPPTLSGFRHLKSLSILDMDTLEYIDELNACVRNCSSSLKTLKLSFSEALANKSSKPPPEPQSDDESAQEEDFQMQAQLQGMPPPGMQLMPLPNPLAGASDPNGPTRVLKAQQEKKRQEAALGRILGNAAVVKPSTVEAIKQSERDEKESAKDPKRRCMENLKPVAARLMAQIKPASESTAEGKKALEMIEKAVDTYLGSLDQDSQSVGSSTAKASPSSSPTTDGVFIMTGAVEPGLFDEKPDLKETIVDTGVSKPEDIDIEEPEGKELDLDEEGDPESKEEEEYLKEERDQMLQPAHSITRAIKETIAKLSETDPLRISALELVAEADELAAVVAQGFDDGDIDNEIIAERTDSLMKKHAALKRDKIESMEQAKETLATLGMSDYVRSTHGLTLEILSIYLIPVKASVLGKAIDFTTLRSITLLNVGTQAPFWMFLQKLNKETPLPLSRIHTDHITSTLLHFIADLKNPEELYFVERDLKLVRVDVAAPKTNVKIEQIRKIVLKKHCANLKVLSLRNGKRDWDLDAKSILLLCQKAQKLEELAASFSVRAMHTLIQFIQGLTSLRALHAIYIPYDHTCPFVNNQFRKFLLDICSHLPDLKLEYLATMESVERLVRKKQVSKPKKVGYKGKEILKALDVSSDVSPLLSLMAGGSSYPDPNPSPTSTSSGWSSTSTSSSNMPEIESSDDEDEGTLTTNFETVGDIKFIDVIGVRIWEKEVVNQRL